MLEKTCCVTGHREISKDCIIYVKQELHRQVVSAIEDGYTRFLCGFAEGADLMFATVVVEEQKKRPELCLEAAIPYAGRLKTRDKWFHELLLCCSEVRVGCEKYTPSCFMQRNRYMVNRSQRVIAVYDGRNYSGTFYTMRYAQSLGRDIRVINV